MSSGGVGCCLHHALTIGQTPRGEWAGAIAQLPEGCQRPGTCSGTEGCRERVADFLRVQFQAQARRERMKGENRA